MPQLLYDTFSAFGVVVGAPKIMRDPDTGLSKGFGFVSFDSFEASGTPARRLPTVPPPAARRAAAEALLLPPAVAACCPLARSMLAPPSPCQPLLLPSARPPLPRCPGQTRRWRR